MMPDQIDSRLRRSAARVAPRTSAIGEHGRPRLGVSERGHARTVRSQSATSRLEADLAVLKDRGPARFRRVLVPWGGGVHAKLGVELAVRVARADQGTVEVLRIVREGVDPEAERARLRKDDLVVIGASRESRLRNVLFGSIPDTVADEADCSVLMVHRRVPEHWTYRLSESVKRMKESVGTTSSPEETGPSGRS